MLLSRATDFISVAVILIVSLAAALVALFILVIWFQEWRNARATRRWPVVSGRVVASKVGSFKGRSSNHTETFYDPLVEYEYTVDDKTYQGKQIAMGVRVSSRTREVAERRIAAYPVDTPVQVSYDPANPGQAVLEHRVAGGGILLFVAAFIFVVLGVLLLPWQK